MLKAKQILPSSGLHNSLASGTIIKGNIFAEEDLRIDGKVEGNIECAGKIVVGPTAEILGQIICTNAELMGKIQGNTRANGTLCLKNSVQYHGDIIAKNLEIEPGALFNGTCKMIAE